MAKITYDNKVSLNPQPSVANINKVSDADMNEIKTSVNALYDASAIQQVNPSDYITINSSFTLASNSPTAYKVGNLVFFNFDITSGTINNGETQIGTCTNKLKITAWGIGRCMEAYPSTNLCPASVIAIPSGAFRIYTTMTGARCAGTIILLVND